eukprot:3018410-Prymnesium_polylepis.1
MAVAVSSSAGRNSCLCGHRRSQGTRVLRRSGSRVASPLSQKWRSITENPSVACSEGAYVKVYYGGDAAAQLQEHVRARLPTNLKLRGHRRSLMFFVSVSESNSFTHFDQTPSVLVCLCGTRTVWLAPPE